MLCIGRTKPSQDVRPSVRPTVTRRYLSKRLNMSSFYSPSGSKIILVFLYQTSWQYSDWDPLTGRRIQGYEKIAIFGQYFAYFGDNTRYGHSYYNANIKACPSFRVVPFLMTKKWPLIQISRSWYYSTSNNSKMERDRAIVFIDRQTDRQTHVSHVSYILSKSSKRIYCILNLCKAGVPTRDIVYILLFSY